MDTRYMLNACHNFCKNIHLQEEHLLFVFFRASWFLLFCNALLVSLSGSPSFHKLRMIQDRFL